jgi:hypothetical protein
MIYKTTNVLAINPASPVKNKVQQLFFGLIGWKGIGKGPKGVRHRHARIFCTSSASISSFRDNGPGVMLFRGPGQAPQVGLVHQHDPRQLAPKRKSCRVQNGWMLRE